MIETVTIIDEQIMKTRLDIGIQCYVYTGDCSIHWYSGGIVEY